MEQPPDSSMPAYGHIKTSDDMFTAWTDVGPAQGRPWTIGGRARGVRRGAAVHGRRVRVPPMACRLSGIEQLEENATKAILKGVKVVEAAAWLYVRIAGAARPSRGAASRNT